MSTYLVRMTPLEPFTFSGEKGFAFESEGTNRMAGNTSYYQTSKEFPEQTTVIGMLRYLMLANSGLLKNKWDYSEQDRTKIKEQIGESFSFEDKEFHKGKLSSVSPVFIVNRKNDPDEISYYIRNPLCNVWKETTDPETEKKCLVLQQIKMEQKQTMTSFGSINLPEKNSYNTKTELSYGYLNIGSRAHDRFEYLESPFETKVITGNCKNGDHVEDSFFKREVKLFKRAKEQQDVSDDLAFAVFVECEKGVLPERTVAMMGLKKSAFMVEVIPVAKNDLEERIQHAFRGYDVWYYALSDLMQPKRINTFSIISKKQVRNLKTDMGKGSFKKAVTRNRHQYNMISAGSVFYQDKPEIENCENLEKAGYNCVIKIGGTT